jgi:hypothetical protein
VGVDHRGLYIAVPKELLNETNISSVLEEMGREGVAKGVAGDPLREPRGERCLLNRILHVRVEYVVTFNVSAPWISRKLC